jgi:hypothetical protein
MSRRVQHRIANKIARHQTTAHEYRGVGIFSIPLTNVVLLSVRQLIRNSTRSWRNEESRERELLYELPVHIVKLSFVVCFPPEMFLM